MKHRILTLALAALLLTGSLLTAAGCRDSGKNDKPTIVCTIFPEYDWTLQVLGEQAANYNVVLLLDSGADLHNYQPTVADIATVSGCGLFVYVGGESDAWVPDVLSSVPNAGRQAIALLETVEAKEEEIKEGMEGEEDGEDSGDGEKEYDEHVWLSLKNAKICVSAICDALCLLDAEHADTYRANAEAYTAQLTALDGQYTEMVASAARKSVLFGDRFPFRYLVDDYGLDYYAAFVGCSAETEASFATVKFLSEKVDELGLPVILVIETSDKSIANTVVQNTAAKNQAILTLNSCQSVSRANINAGVTYLSLMTDNLGVLTQALNNQ